MTPTSHRKPRSVDAGRARSLEVGRAASDAREWSDAFEALSAADRSAPLGDEDLERLAWAAALSGQSEPHYAALERLVEMRDRAGETLRAARAAFWLGFRLIAFSEVGRATAWMSRAQRLVEKHGGDCAERGYLLLFEAGRMLFRDRDAAAAAGIAGRAAAIGEQYADADLTGLARMMEGQATLEIGGADAGLALLDEAMLAATAGRLSPAVTGVVYCGVIGSCRRIYAVDRAREWTAALAEWCERQPQLAAFNGPCRVHRSEILQLHGAWPEALAEAERVSGVLASSSPPETLAAAAYQQGEILRLRGEHAAAEAAYREASRCGRDPQPGLALLWLAQGRGEAAATALRHVVATQGDPLSRARFLPAAVEIRLATGDLEGADEAARDLASIAARSRNPMLEAMAAHADGAVRIARGDATGALDPLRRAFELWQRLDAPYLAARVRALIAAGLTALGDHDGAELECDAAREVLAGLHAVDDLARLDASAAKRKERPFGLTAREVEVLRLVATGRTNRAISAELFLSEKTIDRHVSNIFTKLDVSTRAAATAFAFRHRLV